MDLSIRKVGKFFKNRRLSMALVSVLAAFLLLAQGTDLVHTHDGDLRAQVDCEICLKFGNDDEIIVDSQTGPGLIAAHQSYFQFTPAIPFQAVIAANPRAPPRA
jgi:hypothetical protein